MREEDRMSTDEDARYVQAGEYVTELLRAGDDVPEAARGLVAVFGPEACADTEIAAARLRADTHQERADRLAIALMRARDQLDQLIREDRAVENSPTSINRCCGTCGGRPGALA